MGVSANVSHWSSQHVRVKLQVKVSHTICVRVVCGEPCNDDVYFADCLFCCGKEPNLIIIPT